MLGMIPGEKLRSFSYILLVLNDSGVLLVVIVGVRVFLRVL